MAIPIQRLPLHSDPPLPKPGGTHVLGTNCDMRHHSGLAVQWAHHLRNGEGVHQGPLETIDNEVTDDLGNVRLCTPAAAPGRRSSHASGYNRVDDRQPGSEHTRTPTSPFLPYEPCFYGSSLNPLLCISDQELAVIEELKKHLRRYHGRHYAETSRSRRHVNALASVLVMIIKHHRRQRDLDVVASILIRPSEYHKLQQDLHVLAESLLEIIGDYSSSLSGQHPAASPALPRLASKDAKFAHGLGYAWTGSSCHLNYRRMIMDDRIRDPGVLNDMSVVPGWGDANILPFLHTILVVLISYLIRHLAAISHSEKLYPWKLTSLMLNSLLVSCEPRNKVQDHFPLSENDQLPRPLPEVFALRGQLYAEDYFLNDWFRNDKIAEDEKYFELASWQHLAQSLSQGPSYPHQRPCFMAFASQNKCNSYANTAHQRWEGNHAPVQTCAQQARHQARFEFQDENNLFLQNSWTPVL